MFLAVNTKVFSREFTSISNSKSVTAPYCIARNARKFMRENFYSRKTCARLFTHTSLNFRGSNSTKFVKVSSLYVVCTYNMQQESKSVHWSV